MKKIAVLCISLLLLATVAAPAMAATPKDPYKSEVNKLNAMASELTSLNERLDKVVGTSEPDAHDTKRATNRIEVMAKQLDALNSQLSAILADLPDPYLIESEAFFVALTDVYGATLDLLQHVDSLPALWISSEALDGIRGVAQSIGAQIEEYLRGSKVG
jgi:cytochrome c556